MLIEVAYPKRLETPRRRRIKAEETSAPAVSMTSSSPARTLRTPRVGLRGGHKRRRCVWLQHHALRPERIQQERRACAAESVGADERDQTTTAAIGAGPTTPPAGSPAARFGLCRTLIVLLIAARSRLTIRPLGFLEALLVASREFFACVGKPKEVTRGGFRPNDMPRIKTVRGQRSR